jgi:hypothetical protein
MEHPDYQDGKGEPNEPLAVDSQPENTVRDGHQMELQALSQVMSDIVYERYHVNAQRNGNNEPGPQTDQGKQKHTRSFSLFHRPSILSSDPSQGKSTT